MGSGGSKTWAERKRDDAEDAALKRRIKRFEELYVEDDRSIQTIQTGKPLESSHPLLKFDEETGVIDHPILGSLTPHKPLGETLKPRLNPKPVRMDDFMWEEKKKIVPNLANFKDVDKRALHAHEVYIIDVENNIQFNVKKHSQRLWIKEALAIRNARYPAQEVIERPTMVKKMTQLNGLLHNKALTAEHVITTPKELVYYLAGICRTDLERFRTIFRWIASHIDYDVQHLNTGRPADSSARGVINKGYAVAAGYCELLNELCKIADIESRTISGASKGRYFCPGDYNNFKTSLTGLPTSPNHSWTLVTICKQQYLCDVTWAAGTIERSEENGKYFFKRQWREDYFLADPRSFLERHWPMDEFGGSAPYYQLLDQPFTAFREWGNRPLTGCDAYNLQVELVSHKAGVINMTSDEVEITFKTDHLLDTWAAITSKTGNQAEALRYKHYAVVSHRNKKYTVHVRLPLTTGKGVLILSVYGKLIHGKDELKQHTFEIVTYVLVYPGKSQKKPFPGVLGENIGLNTDGFLAGFEIVSHANPVIHSDNGEVKVVIEAPFYDPLEFTYYLARADKPEAKLLHDSYVERDKNKLICHIRMFARGDHFFILRANLEFDDGPEWITLASFVLVCNTEADFETELQFPIHGKQWGPTRAFFDEGLQVFNQDSSTVVPTDNGKCNIILKRPRAYDIVFSLRTDQNSTHPLMGQIICKETVNDFIRVKLRIPERGQYKLIATKMRNDDGEPGVVLMSYLITCRTPFCGDLYPEHWDIMGPVSAFYELEMTDMCGHCSTKHTKDGQRTLRFKTPIGSHFYFRLRDNDGSSVDSAHSWGYMESNILTIKLRLPRSGYYTFGLYEVNKDGVFVQWLAHYMIKCDSAYKFDLFPKLEAVIGPVPKAQELDITPYDKGFKYFMKARNGKCQVRFTSPKQLRCFHKLASEKKEWNQYVYGDVRTARSGYLMTYRFELPASGYYSFGVWYMNRDQSVQIVNMMILCEKPAYPCKPFFDKSEAWLLGLREKEAEKLGLTPENVDGGTVYSDREGIASLSFILQQPLFQFWCSIEGAGMGSKHLNKFISLAVNGNKTVVVLSPPLAGRYKASFSGRVQRGDSVLTPYTCLIHKMDKEEIEEKARGEQLAIKK